MLVASPDARRKTVRLNPAVVRPPNPDPRKGKRDPLHVQALAKDIMTRGLRNPPYVTIVHSVPIIVTGEHRRLAMVQLGWQEADFHVLEGELSSSQLAIEQWQESELHEGFSPLQKATIAQEIMTAETLTRRQFCEKYGELLGIDESQLTKLFRVKGDLAPGLHEAVEKGELPFSCAYALARLTDKAKQVELAEMVKAELLTRDALESRIKTLLGGKTKKEQPKPVQFVTVGGLVIRCVGGKVEGMLADLLAWIEKVKKVSKKEDEVEILPLLLKRG